jgi:glutamate carboxypeptidase
MLADLKVLANAESFTADTAAVARSAETVARLGARLLGEEPETVTVGGVGHLRWRLGDGPRRLVLVGHHDTVWPIGSWGPEPFGMEDTAEGGVVTGPGVFDMKAGLVQCLHALALLRADGETLDGVTVLVTGDEETGSINSRELIETEARGCLAALILEAAADGGGLKTGRKGVSVYRLEIEGKAAHAGLEPENGINATVEVANQVLAGVALADHDAGTTVTPTVIGAGTSSNTTAADGFVDIDVRAWTAVEQHRVDAAMRSLASTVPGSIIRVSGGINRPPLEQDMTQELYERACRVAAQLGLAQPPAVKVGGGSDGNFTAGMGIPTLDGLGAVGGGAHARSEHVEAARMTERTALLAGLVSSLLSESGAPA